MERDLATALTVADLIRQLQAYPADTPVYFMHPAHDHWKTTLATGVQILEAGPVTWSNYHQQPVIPVEDENDPEDDIEVVLLGAA
jgi:hypothetical protein